MTQARSKGDFGIERLRNSVSRIMAAILFLLMLFTRPAAFATTPYQILELIGFLMIFLGVFGRIWSTLFIAGRKNRLLCTKGPYEMCRNPLYFFSFIGFVGILLASQSLIVAVAIGAIFLSYYSGVIKSNETRLRILFGSQLEEHTSTNPKFLPRLKIPRNNHQLLVDCEIFTRSLRDVIWLMLVIILVEAIELLKSTDSLPSLAIPF